MKLSSVLSALICCSFVFAVQADDAPKKKAATKERPKNQALAPIEDVAGLPRVLLIGDSISIGYTIPTRELLQGKANVHRIPANAATTVNGLKNIEAWLGEKNWDVIHFNWGLHDMKYIGENNERVTPDKGKVQVPLDEYAANLRKLVQRLKQTKAQLIWCSTTPVPEGSDGRIANDELKYNAVATQIMNEEKVTINDLYSFAKPQMDKIGLPANVHYSPEGYQVLARQVASTIEQAIGK
jgi:hypothetical protein